MPPRKRTATVELKVRMKEPLRAKIEKAAKRRGVSMNAEAVDRLERSFSRDDIWDGDATLRNMALIMAAAFARGGERGAHSRKHPEWSPADWLNDSFCYEVAATAVGEALKLAQPVRYESNNPDEEQRKLQEKINQIFANIVARGGDVTIARGEEENQ